MPVTIGPLEDAVVLKFGGGQHSRASEDEIDPRECTTGQNYQLDLENRQYKNREPFDLIGTVPNATEIRGFASLQKRDGTVSFLVQAGDSVYDWDGASTFTLKGLVAAQAQLRGRLEHNWNLDDEVLITDLNLQQPVMKYDGTTLVNISHNLTGDFLAKYCFVADERAHFGNVISNSTPTPQMLVGSKQSDFTVLSISDRPSSSLALDDPFFLLTLDLKPINGMIEAFRKITLSSEEGSIFNINGSSAKDFTMEGLYARSGASGNESLVYVGNDILYGRAGRIESLADTNRFGDVENIDPSVKIFDAIGKFTNWTNVYNSRTQKAYFFPAGQGQIWVLHKSLLPTELSPWVKHTTLHSSGFAITAMMNMLDPVDGLEYVFFGDANGNIYRMEGTGAGDAGTDINSSRTSKIFTAPLDAEDFGVEGWIKYRKNEAVTVTLTLLWTGETASSETITIDIPAISDRPLYGNAIYYSNGESYGTAFAQRLIRKPFGVSGQNHEFQVKVEVEGTTNFEINEVGLRFNQAS